MWGSGGGLALAAGTSCARREGRVCGSSSRHVEWLCLRELFSLGKMGDLRSLASGISLRDLSHVQPCCRVGK